MRGIVQVILRRRLQAAASDQHHRISRGGSTFDNERLIALESQDRKATGLCQEYIVVLLVYCNHE